MGKCRKKSKWMKKFCCATCKQVLIDESVGAGKVKVKTAPAPLHLTGAKNRRTEY